MRLFRKGIYGFGIDINDGLRIVRDVRFLTTIFVVNVDGHDVAIIGYANIGNRKVGSYLFVVSVGNSMAHMVTISSILADNSRNFARLLFRTSFTKVLKMSLDSLISMGLFLVTQT